MTWAAISATSTPQSRVLLVASAERLFRVEPDGSIRWQGDAVGIDGVARMMAPRDDEYCDLDIRARTLLVPPELQQTAMEILESDFIQWANSDVPTGNALKSSVSLEVEPRLSNDERFTGTSAKAWHLFAGTQDAALIVAFLQGKTSAHGRVLRPRRGPEQAGRVVARLFRPRATLGDYRAAYRAKGEA